MNRIQTRLDFTNISDSRRRAARTRTGREIPIPFFTCGENDYGLFGGKCARKSEIGFCAGFLDRLRWPACGYFKETICENPRNLRAIKFDVPRITLIYADLKETICGRLNLRPRLGTQGNGILSTWNLQLTTWNSDWSLPSLRRPI